MGTCSLDAGKVIALLWYRGSGTLERTMAMSSTDGLTYDVFINDPPPQDNGFLPNGEPRLFPLSRAP
jgi:hypothetical protein